MSLENKVIIDAKNVGITYDKNAKKDDYKSTIIGSFSKNKHSNKDSSSVTWPIRNINFQGYQGEVLGIIGSNGSGKTTLCRTLTGLLKPDEGEINIDGKVTALFSLGMGFKKKLSGRENVYLNGMMMGISKDKIDEMIDEIHQFSGIGDFFDESMKKYSSGMKSRLGFSVAAFLEPEILILDESLNTGDRAFSKKAAKKIKELVSNAKMVILVTHSHRFAKQHCDRLIWLEKGEILEIGDPKTVLKNYQKSVPKVKRRPKKQLELVNIDAQKKERVIVRATDLSLTYPMGKGLHKALNNVSFTINEGEVVGIIGHNGAGKSTLCKMLTQILTPDDGELFIDGETTALLNYGTGFNRNLSAIDNIYLNGMLLGVPRAYIEARVDSILEFAELTKVKDRSIKYYSSGMRSRLGFSIAAILQPDIFIIDEALSTGDLAFRQKASEKIREMMEQAKAVIVVSHSMGFVERVCTRAIWLDHGEIVADGDAEEVVDIYRERNGKRP